MEMAKAMKENRLSTCESILGELIISASACWSVMTLVTGCSGSNCDTAPRTRVLSRLAGLRLDQHIDGLARGTSRADTPVAGECA